MSDLRVIEFPSEEKAEGVREMLLAMQKEYLIELGDAVIAVKEAGGRVKLNQLFQPVARGAVSGALWGSLIGLLFMMPLGGRQLVPPPARSAESWRISASTTTLCGRRRGRCNPAMPRCSC